MTSDKLLMVAVNDFHLAWPIIGGDKVAFGSAVQHKSRYNLNLWKPPYQQRQNRSNMCNRRPKLRHIQCRYDD